MRRILGLMLALGLLSILQVQTAPAKEEPKAKHKPTIAVFRLHGSVSESPNDEDFPLAAVSKSSFRELVARMKKASADDAVKAVVLISESPGLGGAQIEELRQAMAELRSKGKDIYVHSDSLVTLGQFVLISGATRISAVPTADLWLTGMYGEAAYIRGLLDKIGVQPDILHCGSYKSAGEMFMRDEPSPEAEKMQNWLLDSLFDTSVASIAKGRGVEVAKVRTWIDEGPYTAESAKAAGIIDAVEHREEFTALLKSKFGNNVVFNTKYGEKKPPQLDFNSPFGLLKFWTDMLAETQKHKKTKTAVGIVYVEGAIALGKSQPSLFGSSGAMSTDIRKALDDAAADDSIKAVVLRVDSPGGSAVASEIILHATKRLKAKKPFVVSMGNVAASGGYYVACGADTIFADNATITGSIGVVGGKFATNDMWKNVGITFKEYKRGKNADLLSTAHVFTKSERERMQAWMDSIYEVFKGHVTTARGKRLNKQIDELAGGRVYTGRQALELGLVDKIGSLQDAIQYIAAEAKLEDYDIRTVPEPKNFLEKLMEETSGEKEDAHKLDLSSRRSGSQTSLIDVAMPHLQHMDPQRVELIKQALLRLQLMQREGAVLMMPEFQIKN